MKTFRWVIGLILILAFLVFNLVLNISTLQRFINPLLLSCFLCLFRIIRGPSPADRAVAIDTLGILIIAFCGLLAVFTKFDFFIDIAIAWALQAFIGTLALAKYLEGRSFDE
ncbi:MAG TPA: multiple resistance and pH regulation protein F [Elusimicrobia bacterium]|nr:multiple resistance and pH regulation protein F [Elusimicrobiota bacterium]